MESCTAGSMSTSIQVSSNYSLYRVHSMSFKYRLSRAKCVLARLHTIYPFGVVVQTVLMLFFSVFIFSIPSKVKIIVIQSMLLSIYMFGPLAE